MNEDYETLYPQALMGIGVSMIMSGGSMYMFSISLFGWMIGTYIALCVSKGRVL